MSHAGSVYQNECKNSNIPLFSINTTDISVSEFQRPSRKFVVLNIRRGENVIIYTDRFHSHHMVRAVFATATRFAAYLSITRQYCITED